MAAALPTVTLGVASFNNAHYLRATLESIRQQTYPHVEVIIVDDASRDDSVAVAEAWMQEFPEMKAQLIRHETNLGVCRVCNDIVGAAQGKYLCIIGSDDLFLPTKLAQQVPILEAASPNVAVLYSNIERIDPEGKLLTTEQHSPMPGSGKLFEALVGVNSIAAMSTLVRRSALLEVGPYDESLAFEDWDMWLRLARRFEFLYDPRISAQYRIHPGSATYKRRAQIAESCIRLLQKQLGVSPETDRLIAEHTSEFAETLYFLGKPSTHWLRQRWRHRRDARSLIMLNAAHLGIPAAWLSKAMSLMRSKPN